MKKTHGGSSRNGGGGGALLTHVGILMLLFLLLITFNSPRVVVGDGDRGDATEDEKETDWQRNNSRGTLGASIGINSGQLTAISTTSVTLRSGVDFVNNQANISFSIDMTYSKSGQVCFSAIIHDSHGGHDTNATKCPYPDIYIRLIGASVVVLQLNTMQTRPPGSWSSLSSPLFGCVWLPISGLYHVDAHLLTCTIHRPSMLSQLASADELKTHCVIRPDYDRSTQQRAFSFRVDEFDHDPNIVLIRRWQEPMMSLAKSQQQQQQQQQQHHRFNYSAWIYAPACPGADPMALTSHSENCTRIAKDPPFVETKFQLEEFLLHRSNWTSWQHDHLEYTRFDNYLWLPVDFATGRPRYRDDDDGDAPNRRRFATALQVPSPQPPQHRGTICFVGDSHARYIFHEVKKMYYNNSNGRDACENDIYTEIHHNPGVTVRYNLLRHADDWLKISSSHYNNNNNNSNNKSSSTTQNQQMEELGKCDFVHLMYGHWESGWPRNYPTPPYEFQNLTEQILQTLEDATRPTTRIWLHSLNRVPMMDYVLQCPPYDFRSVALVDAYNAVLEELIPSSTSLQKTTYVDNRDLNDPLWDSAMDWVHPCRNVFRPLAMRVIELMEPYY